MSDLSAPPPPSRLNRETRPNLAYRHTQGTGPALVFLPGYASDMAGGKATAVFDWAVANGRACTLLDYSGCGESDGAFREETLESWRDDVLDILAATTPDGPLILIGSSMGGWLMLLIALGMPERIAGLIGIAPAPDFTHWGFSGEEVATLKRDQFLNRGGADAHDSQTTTLAFWQAGQNNLLLNDAIPLSCPVALLHGMEDEAVPYAISMQIAQRLRSDSVRIHLVKSGDHRLSREQDIALLIATVAAMPFGQED